METLCKSDIKALENGLSVIRCAHLNAASDQLELVMTKIPRLVELKEENSSKYNS